MSAVNQVEWSPFGWSRQVLDWHLQLGVVPLPKANRPEHLRENLDVFDVHVSDEHMRVLSDLDEHCSALGRLAYL